MIVDFTDKILEAKEKKTLNKPFRTPGGPKKFSVYVKNEKGNVVKVNFGDPNMEIKRDDPARRKSFRARHNCDNPGPKTKARYWSCKQWRAGKRVQGSEVEYEWDGQTFFDHDELLTINPALAFIEEEVNEPEDDDCGCGNCNCEEVEAKHDMKKYSFNNPGQAMQMARKMGFDKVHTHGEGDDTVFMPGPSHEALMKKLGESKAEEEYASLWENIKKKRDRIKSGSGEKMRKKGEKGAPTPEQMEKAKNKSKKKKMSSGYAYEMTLEEFEEVMDLEEIEFWKEESDAAKRPGRKSGAQTPAKPSERKKGSSKNKPGSAGKGGPSITFSEKVTKSLKEKVKNHNAKSKKKVTLSQLKKVYRRGAGAFSSSHRPGMSRGGWAMARVNMFLKMKRGGKVKDSYRKADGDI
tara:strand:+ start:269 stop:1492 length:1224 start_codon:yes stop_codon:yes gene_type:complete